MMLGGRINPSVSNSRRPEYFTLYGNHKVTHSICNTLHQTCFFLFSPQLYLGLKKRYKTTYKVDMSVFHEISFYFLHIFERISKQRINQQFF
jgi:hypothetical protein